MRNIDEFSSIVGRPIKSYVLSLVTLLHMNRWPVFLMLVCASHLLVAQADDSSEPLSFTLQECIDYAIRHNINVRQSEWSVVGDQVALRQSKADLFPSLNANTSFSYNVGRTINPFTNEYVEQPISQQNLNLGANLVLFNGLRKLNTIKQNKANVAVSQLDLEATKNNITLNVINAYTQILFNQELLETRQFQRLTSQDQFKPYAAPSGGRKFAGSRRPGGRRAGSPG